MVFRLTLMTLLIAQVPAFAQHSGSTSSIEYEARMIILQRSASFRNDVQFANNGQRTTQLWVEFKPRGNNSFVKLRDFRIIFAEDDTGKNLLLPDRPFVNGIDKNRLYEINSTYGLRPPNKPDNPGFSVMLDLAYPEVEATTISLRGQFEYTLDSEAGVLEVTDLKSLIGKPLLPDKSKLNLVPLIVGEHEIAKTTQHVIDIEIRGEPEQIGHARFFDESGNEIRPMMTMKGAYLADIDKIGVAYYQWAVNQDPKLSKKPFREMYRGSPWEGKIRPTLSYRFQQPLPQTVRMSIALPTDEDVYQATFEFHDLKLP